ncbi:MAG TPA: hypothetical protein VFP80_03030 [Thermoanaerobaculia bacterium]|nr:hypothetical protein [Thermoanaerobaculia bacterium]
MNMRPLVLLLVLALPASAQDLFPRFSLTAAASPAKFETNARIDPEILGGEGTLVRFERDLGLEDSRTLQRFGLQWRPFHRHELALSYFSAPRNGLEQIDRDIVFRDQVYPVSALVTSEFDLDYASLTYTYWARRGERDGLGLTLGVATLAMDASVSAVDIAGGGSVSLTQRAETDVPVALAGLQGRVAFTPRLHGEASVSTLPRVTIEDYTGRALTGAARLEYRPLRWLGIGAAYHYFRLDVDVAQTDLSGSLDMTIQGPEAYLRLAF